MDPDRIPLLAILQTMTLGDLLRLLPRTGEGQTYAEGLSCKDINLPPHRLITLGWFQPGWAVKLTVASSIGDDGKPTPPGVTLEGGARGRPMPEMGTPEFESLWNQAVESGWPAEYQPEKVAINRPLAIDRLASNVQADFLEEMGETRAAAMLREAFPLTNPGG